MGNFEYHMAFFLFLQEWLEKKNVYLHEMHRIKRIESENLRIQNEQVFWNIEEKNILDFYVNKISLNI